ncbi:MAG: DNA-formamidopyrimidine glycosylase [Parcubacteria group bacterium QH_9_35_7]|nr:MAG: DNA-formamidopyrimidine glycosylase [Parcubacteria group bacterium QH_9_35_7]
MPELPEVETIRRDLQNKILDKEISQVEVKKESAIKNEIEKFKQVLSGESFSDLNREAKLLVFDIEDSDQVILSHLRMTGKYVYDSGTETEFPTKHTGVIITFENKDKLYFDDIRTFGYMQIVTEKQKEDILSKKLGIEPLTDSFTLENFQRVLENRRTNIKNLLTNQQAIAGIGNIYADEICFESKIKPDRKVPTLEDNEIEELYENIEQVLQKAIDYRGTTFRDYIDTAGESGNFKKELKVYNREEKPCYDCKTLINKVKLSGRGTHFCSNCQQ